MKKTISIIVSVLLLVGIGGWYLVKEADASEPGDALYSVDLATESIQRFFTFDEVASVELEEDILDERAEELESLTGTETVDEDLVTQATDNLTEQQSRVQTRLEEESGNTNGELEQLRTRYEEQVEEHLQVMEQVRIKVQGEETQLKVQEAVDAYENSLETESPDETNATEDNNTSSGNDSAGSSQEEESSSGNGNGRN